MPDSSSRRSRYPLLLVLLARSFSLGARCIPPTTRKERIFSALAGLKTARHQIQYLALFVMGEIELAVAL